VAALRVTKRCRIFKRDAVQWIQGLEAGAYRVAFVDPPYGSRKLDLVIQSWTQVPFADILVIEHDKEHELAARGKRYDFPGPTRVTVLRARRAQRSRSASDGAATGPGEAPGPSPAAPRSSLRRPGSRG
jgi:16S rRNA G966 N2-methylase RsmD